MEGQQLPSFCREAALAQVCIKCHEQPYWYRKVAWGWLWELGLGIRKFWQGPVLLTIRELKQREGLVKRKVAIILAHKDLTSSKARSNFFLQVE